MRFWGWWWVVWVKSSSPCIYLTFSLTFGVLISAVWDRRPRRKEKLCCLNNHLSMRRPENPVSVLCVFLCLESPITTEISDRLSLADRTATGAGFSCPITLLGLSCGRLRGKCLSTFESCVHSQQLSFSPLLSQIVLGYSRVKY